MEAAMDHFHLTVAELPPLESITKCLLVSDIAKTCNVLGWFSPSTVLPFHRQGEHPSAVVIGVEGWLQFLHEFMTFGFSGV